jgi:hypothetical protein
VEIYDLFQQNEYSDDFKAMLDNEYEQYQKDREVVSRDEVNKLIAQLFDSLKGIKACEVNASSFNNHSSFLYRRVQNPW